MADGFTISATGLADARKALRARAMRVADMRPALKVVAAEIDRRTEESFQSSKSQFGEPFAPLAESTKLARLRQHRGTSRRTKSGAYTKSVQAKRQKLLAPGGMKPLINTGRAKNSAHTVVDTATSLRWSAVGYLGPHLTGGQRAGKLGMPPQRNVSVFVKMGGDFDFAGGGWRLDASMQSYLNRVVSNYIATGNAVAS